MQLALLPVRHGEGLAGSGADDEDGGVRSVRPALANASRVEGATSATLPAGTSCSAPSMTNARRAAHDDVELLVAGVAAPRRGSSTHTVTGLRAEERVDAECADAEVVAHRRASPATGSHGLGGARDVVERDDHRRTCAARSPSSSTTLSWDERIGDRRPAATSSAATTALELADESLTAGQRALVERGRGGRSRGRRRALRGG